MPSVDSVALFTLQLVMVFECIRSERQLIAIAGLNLAHPWYLGYAQGEDLSDHSSLTRIANAPAPWVVDPFAMSASQSIASSSLHQGDQTLVPAN
jgi:transposase-like protein DUF772